MMTIWIVAIIAATTIIITALSMWWEYKNPYIDEEHNRINVYNAYSGKDDMPYKIRIEYKRTYKNGKVTYITKDR